MDAFTPNWHFSETILLVVNPHADAEFELIMTALQRAAAANRDVIKRAAPTDLMLAPFSKVLLTSQPKSNQPISVVVLCLTAVTHTHRHRSISKHPSEDRILFTQLSEDWVGERRDRRIRSRRGDRYSHQSFRLSDWRPLQQDGVNQAEDRRVRLDAQSK
jgi:hypothetical protein